MGLQFDSSVYFLITFFLLSIFFSFLTNWLLLRLSFNLGTRNNEELKSQRWASNVKPAVGGISFFIVFLISISVIGALPRESNFFLDKRIIGITAASSLGFLIGLADDAYNTNPLVKFIGQLCCAFILILSDINIDVFSHPALNYAITIVWVIGLMNSINMLDNMDAITTSTSISILFGVLMVIFVSNSHDTNHLLVMIVGVLGSLIGFMYYNWNPSKIFMGDTGSQFLGVFLAACGILFFWGQKSVEGGFYEIKQFVLPLLFFIIPIVDTTTVTFRRLMRKQSPFVGGKDHLSHHLVYLGLSEKQTAIALNVVSLLSLPIAYLLLKGYIEWDFLTSIYLFVYVAIVFLLLQFLYDKGKQKQIMKASVK